MKKILKIARMGHPILQFPAKRVEKIDDAIRGIIADMIHTLEDLESFAGLAAPQVHIPLRLMMFTVPKQTDNPKYDLTPEYDPEGVPLTVLINPIWKPLSDVKINGWEGCLSIPNMMGKVPRYQSIKYEGMTESGSMIERDVHGFHARVVQHECDHLDGILYPEKIRNMKHFGFQKEVLQFLKKPNELSMDE